MYVLIVEKYGGTSLADEERLQAVAAAAAELRSRGHSLVITVSAQGDTTDRLLRQGQKVFPGAGGRELDALLAAGEQMSAALLAMALQSRGCRAVSLTGWQAGIHTDGVPGNAGILYVDPGRIRRELAMGNVAVVSGFQGADSGGNITTLGRGGSDTTAVALAAALKADRCRIFTDVDGVYDRDPRIFPDAVRYERIGFDAMLALARSGARVLHDRCVELAKQYGIVLEVCSAFEDRPGTWVGDSVPEA